MIKPYKNSNAGKKDQVASMFNNIAWKYDFLNHFLSLGIDRIWRKKAISFLKVIKPASVLDIATGTGDFAIQALDLNPDKVVGVDIATKMIEIGNKKLSKRKLDHKIQLQYGDSENLEFSDQSFDSAICAFGVRNFEHLEKGLAEIYRVLAYGGRFVILEFSMPRKFPVKQLYNFYFYQILPFFGKVFSKDSSAYSYLPDSVGQFPDGEDFINILNEIGYKNVQEKRLSFGICTIYSCDK